MEGIEQLAIRQTGGGAVLSVKVVPGSSRDRVVGVLGESLKIATSAPPEKGKANTAVAKILAKALGIDARNIRLVSGPTSPRKEFQIDGMSADSVRTNLQAQ